MIKLLSALLLFSVVLLGQPTEDSVVHNTSSCQNVTSCATAAQSHTAGKFLIAFWLSSSSEIPTITNAASDTWLSLSTSGSGSTGYLGAYYVRATNGNASDVVTVHTIASDARLDVTVIELSGAASVVPIDVNLANLDSSTATLTTGSFTTRTANQIILIAGLSGNTSSFTAGTGYTMDDTSVDVNMGIEHKSVTSVQTGVTAQMSGTGVASPWVYEVFSVSATDLPAPAWTITKTHSGNFTQGDYGDAYTVTISNTGTASTDGSLVTMTETIPTQMGVISMSGTGWTCSYTTCKRGDVLATSTSYPAITVKVWVSSSATSPKVNNVSVSGGGASGTTSTTDSTVINSGPSTITLASNPNVSWSCGGTLNCSTSIRQAGHAAFPLEVDISGAGTITVGSCSAGNSCAAIVPKICSVQPCDNATTAPAGVFFVMDSYDNPTSTFPVGVHTASFPITGSGGGSGTVNLTWTSIARTDPTFGAYSGSITNCSSSGSWPLPTDLTRAGFPSYATFTMPLAGVQCLPGRELWRNNQRTRAWDEYDGARG